MFSPFLDRNGSPSAYQFHLRGQDVAVIIQNVDDRISEAIVGD